MYKIVLTKKKNPFCICLPWDLASSLLITVFLELSTKQVKPVEEASHMQIMGFTV